MNDDDKQLRQQVDTFTLSSPVKFDEMNLLCLKENLILFQN